MFWGSFDVPIGVIILVLLIVFWKPVTSKILLWIFVIITFPFVALWKGIRATASKYLLPFAYGNAVKTSSLLC